MCMIVSVYCLVLLGYSVVHVYDVIGVLPCSAGLQCCTWGIVCHGKYLILLLRCILPQTMLHLCVRGEVVILHMGWIGLI